LPNLWRTRGPCPQAAALPPRRPHAGRIQRREAYETWCLLPTLVALAAAAAPGWLAAETSSCAQGASVQLVQHSAMNLVSTEVHRAVQAVCAQALGAPTGPQVLRGRDAQGMLQAMLEAAAHCNGRVGSSSQTARGVSGAAPSSCSATAANAEACGMSVRWGDMMGWASGFGR
jgi:hypothetical protein